MNINTINSYMKNMARLKEETEKQEQQKVARQNQFPKSKLFQLTVPEKGNHLLTYFNNGWQQHFPTQQEYDALNKFPFYAALIKRGLMEPWNAETMKKAGYTANVIFLDKEIGVLLKENDLRRVYNGAVPEEAKTTDENGNTVYKQWVLSPYSQYEYKIYNAASKSTVFHDVVSGIDNVIKHNPIKVRVKDSMTTYSKHIDTDPDLVNYLTVLDLRPNWYFDRATNTVKFMYFTKRLLRIKNSQFNDYISNFIVPKILEKYADGDTGTIYGAMARLQRDITDNLSAGIGDFVALKEDVKNDKYVMSQMFPEKVITQVFMQEKQLDKDGAVIPDSDRYYLDSFNYTELFPDPSDSRLAEQYGIGKAGQAQLNEIHIEEVPSSLNAESTKSVSDDLGLDVLLGEAEGNEGNTLENLQSEDLLNNVAEPRKGKPAPSMPPGIDKVEDVKQEVKEETGEEGEGFLDSIEDELPF